MLVAVMLDIVRVAPAEMVRDRKLREDMVTVMLELTVQEVRQPDALEVPAGQNALFEHKI